MNTVLYPNRRVNRSSGSLLTDLTAYWKLDEASGNAVDSSINGRTLTNVGGVTFGAGKINNGSIHVPTRFFTRADEVALKASLNMSFSFWFSSTDGNTQLITRDNNVAGQREYAILLGNGGGQVQFFIFQGTGNSNVLTTGTTFNDGAWHHIIITVTNGQPRVAIDGGAFKLGNTPITAVNTSAVDFMVAARLTGAGGNGYTGMLDEIGFWQGRALTQTDVAKLWNGGAGLSYPF